MSEVQDVIDAPATVAAIKPESALDLEKLDLAALAVAKFGNWRGDVAKVRKTLDGAVHDLSTQAKVDEAKSLRFRLIGQPRADVRKVSKALKSKLAAVSKAVGAEEDLAVTEYDAAETLITPLIEAREALLIAERAERERIEAERIARHEAGIAKIRAYLARCQEPGMSADRISVGIGMLEGVTFGADWQEFAVPAANAQCETLEAMRKLHAQAVEREAEAARLEAQRIEQARVAAEQAAERERQAAEQARIDAEQAERQRQLDALDAALKANMRRIADHQRRIDEIKQAATGHIGQSAATIAEAISVVAALNCTSAVFEEMSPLAAAAQASTLSVLWTIHDDAAERERIAAEAVAKFQAQRAEVTTPQDSQQVLKAEPATADATDRDAPADASPRVGAMGEGQAADAAPVADLAPEPTLTIGDINTRIAPLNIDGTGLALLGFEPAAARKGAKLFHESDWPAMRAAMLKILAGGA